MENLGRSMIVNTYKVQSLPSGCAPKMMKSRRVELSLRALRCYDPDDYIAEINELYDCIVEKREYEDEPALTEDDMIDILERLTVESTHVKKNSLRNILYRDTTSGQKTASTRRLLSDILLDY